MLLALQKSRFLKPWIAGGHSEKSDLHSMTTESKLMQTVGNTTSTINLAAPADKTLVLLHFLHGLESPRNYSHLVQDNKSSRWPFCTLFVARLFRDKLHGKAPSFPPAFRPGLCLSHFLKAAGKLQHWNLSNSRSWVPLDWYFSPAVCLVH